MQQLVAVDLVGGDEFVRTMLRVWDRGDAILPVDQRLPRGSAAALMATLGAACVIDRGGERPLDHGEPVADGDAIVVATSGSTGSPKGVVLTHDAVRASAVASQARLGTDAADHWLACLPLAHVGGLSVLTRALVNEIPLTVLPRFDPAAVTGAAHRGATLTSLVPTALARIDPALFRRIVLGGSRPPADRPPNVVASYGMTETGSGIVYDGVPLDGVEIAIAPDGEVLVRCPMMLRCYRDNSTPVDGDGWLHTDDLGRWMDDGSGAKRLHVDGRRGELIISGGENVWPETIEAALATHPQVADVAVAGVDDSEWGQLVTAWVVPADHGDPPTLAQLRTHVAQTLPAFMAPRSVVLVERIPRTNLAKIRRNMLTNP